MRSIISFGRSADRKPTTPFAIRSKAADPAIHVKMAAVFVLALLTMIAAGMMTMHPSKASQADELTGLATQELSTSKGDRIASSKTSESCRTQTWGAWSEDCAAELTGATRVRNVSFVTVEKTTPTVNETILARYPTGN